MSQGSTIEILSHIICPHISSDPLWQPHVVVTLGASERDCYMKGM